MQAEALEPGPREEEGVVLALVELAEPRLDLGAVHQRRGCGKLYRARSRMYRSQILQENMCLKALAEIYAMHSFAQL